MLGVRSYVALITIILILSLIIPKEKNPPIEEAAFIKSINNTAPKDRIKEEDIKIYNNRVIIDIKDGILARFTDTKSMEPVLDKTTNAIEVIPKSIDDIKIGDIISYNSNFSDKPIIHRVIDIDSDKKGTYFLAKGDNTEDIDPEKIRFEKINRVVVGILY